VKRECVQIGGWVGVFIGVGRYGWVGVRERRYGGEQVSGKK